jgi:hypothetical protein
LQQILSTSISFPKLIFTPIAHIKKSWDPLMAILQPSLIFKFNYGAALREIMATFITGSTLITLIRHRWQPWQLMQLDIATLPALEILAIGVT